jgi:hypothetical protein
MPTSRLGTRACDRPGDSGSWPGRGAGGVPEGPAILEGSLPDVAATWHPDSKQRPNIYVDSLQESLEAQCQPAGLTTRSVHNEYWEH